MWSEKSGYQTANLHESFGLVVIPLGLDDRSLVTVGMQDVVDLRDASFKRASNALDKTHNTERDVVFPVMTHQRKICFHQTIRVHDLILVSIQESVGLSKKGFDNLKFSRTLLSLTFRTTALLFL